MKEHKEPYFGSSKPSTLNIEKNLSDESRNFRPTLSNPKETKSLRINFGIYLISIYLISSAFMYLGNYTNFMSDIGKMHVLKDIDLSGSVVTYFQLSVLFKTLVAVVFITIAFLRIKYFRIISSILLIFGAVFSGLSLFNASVIDPEAIVRGRTFGKLISAVIIAVSISSYLIFRKRVKQVFG